MNKPLSVKDIEHLANLSNLQVDPHEVESLSKQLEETIEYIENLNELDTQSVSESVQSERTNINFNDGEKNARQLSQKEALVNSKKTKGEYFVVTRVI